eukprot:s614_g25.t1
MTIHQPRRRLRAKTAPPPCYTRKPGIFKVKENRMLFPTLCLKRRMEKTRDYMVIQKALDAKELQELQEVLKRKRPKAAKMKNEGTGAESDDERKDTIGFGQIRCQMFLTRV